MHKGAMKAYGAATIDEQVATASPHRLIVMLFDGAIKSINLAKFHLQQGNIASKGENISKAIAIIEEGLRLSLDKQIGGEIVNNLDSLYEYAAYQLMVANLHNRLELMDEVLLLLNQLKLSWESIDPRLQISPQSSEKLPELNNLSFGRA